MALPPHIKTDYVVFCESPFRQSKIRKPTASRSHMARRGKNENQVHGRGVDRVAFDGGSCGCIGTRSDPGGEGSRAAISGNDKKECSGDDERSVGSAVELQAGAGPLVGGTDDGAHRRSRGLYPRLGEGKGHDGAGRGSWTRREENRRRGAGDGSRPLDQSAGARAAGTDKSLRVTGRVDQAFRGEPRDNGEFSEDHDGPARSRRGQPAGKAGWLRVYSAHRSSQRTAHEADQ